MNGMYCIHLATYIIYIYPGVNVYIHVEIAMVFHPEHEQMVDVPHHFSSTPG